MLRARLQLFVVRVTVAMTLAIGCGGVTTTTGKHVDVGPPDAGVLPPSDAGISHASVDSGRPVCGVGPGAKPCATSEVCVRWDMGSVSCKPNPCGAFPLSCDCAASLCGGQICGSAQDGKVGCFCPSC